MRIFGWIAALSVVAAGAAGARAEPLRSLTVTGDGVVAAAPDMASVTLGVETQADSARAAMDQASEVVRAVLDRAERFGLDPRDVQTADLSISPLYESRSTAPGRPRIDGYQASNRLTLRVRDLPSLGGLLDAVLTDGANSLYGLSFGVADPAPHYAEARRRAVADARARAEVFAAAAGVALGPVLTISEGGAPAPGPMMAEMRMASADVPIAAGEAEIRAQVTIVYGLVDAP